MAAIEKVAAIRSAAAAEAEATTITSGKAEVERARNKSQTQQENDSTPLVRSYEVIFQLFLNSNGHFPRVVTVRRHEQNLVWKLDFLMESFKIWSFFVVDALFVF